MIPLKKIKNQNQFIRGLCDVEEIALSMCKEIDLLTMEPEIVLCSSGVDYEVFNYWRVVISSEPQTSSFCGGGRQAALLIRDKVSGGILGITAISDMRTKWQAVEDYLGWEGNPDLREAHQHRILMLRRCLPVYEFGQMVGGKMLALSTLSQDFLRVLELRYSYQFLLFALFTLHGKSSQYNRLHTRGLDLLSVDDRGRGFYGMELRKKAVPFLRGEADAYGKTNAFTLSDQVEYWKDRWLKSRMTSLSVGSTIKPDPERYRLSNMLDQKRMTLSALETTEGNDDVEG